LVRSCYTRMAKERIPFSNEPVRAGEADMNKARSPTPADYAHLLKEIKSRILQVPARAIFTVNAGLIYLYKDIGIGGPISSSSS
jgi:hypothetical protein